MLGSQQLPFIMSRQSRPTKTDIRGPGPRANAANVCVDSDAWFLSPSAGDLCSERRVNEGWTPPRRHCGVWMKRHEGKSLWSCDADASLGFWNLQKKHTGWRFLASAAEFWFGVPTHSGPERVPTAPAVQGGGSHGPGDVGRVLLGLHAQHGDAGRASLKLWLGLEGVVAVGPRSQERVCAEEVVEGHVAELVLLVGEAHVAVVGGAGGRAGGVRV